MNSICHIFSFMKHAFNLRPILIQGYKKPFSCIFYRLDCLYVVWDKNLNSFYFNAPTYNLLNRLHSSLNCWYMYCTWIHTRALFLDSQCYNIHPYYICSYASTTYCLNFCSFLVGLEIMKYKPSNFVLIEIGFAILDILDFYVSITISFSSFEKSLLDIFRENNKFIDKFEGNYHLDSSLFQSMNIKHFSIYLDVL